MTKRINPINRINASPIADITGLILAGGRAMRMNQCDKGLQDLHGQRLVAHVINRVEPQVGTLFINANRHLDQYTQFGFSVYSDTQADFKGPLAGVEVGLIHCATPYLLTVPCDSPFLPMNLAARLMQSLCHHEADCAIACTGDVNQPRDQPVFCLIKKSMLNHIQYYLASGGRKMDGWFEGLIVAKVHFDDESAFSNINTAAELQAYSLGSDFSGNNKKN